MSYASEVAADSPAAYYKLDEAAGSTSAADAQGGTALTSTGNGVTFGTPTLLTGSGSAITTIAGGYLQRTNGSAMFAGQAALTLECLYQLPASFTGFIGIAGIRNADVADSFYIMGLSPTSLEVRFRNSAGTIFGATVTTTPSVRHHIALVLSGTTLTVIQDGAQATQVTAVSGTIGSSTLPFRVGDDGNGSASVGGGIVDEVAVYQSALTLTRAQAHWTAAQTLSGTYQKARPASDSSVGTWTTDTGATTNLYTAIDEADTPVDTDYVRSAVGPDGTSALDIALSSVTDPSSTADHWLQVRAYATAGTITLTRELRNGAAAFSTPITWTDTLTTGATTYTNGLTSTQAGLIASASAYGTLRLRLTATEAAAAPTVVGDGGFVSTSTNGQNLTPALPTGWAADDIFVLDAERKDNTAMTSLVGWTQVLANSSSTGLRTELWWRRAVAGDTAPTITFGTGTTLRSARIIAVRGCPTGSSPFGQTSGAADAISILGSGASSTTVSTTDVTPVDAASLGLFIASTGSGPAGNGMSQPAGWSTFTFTRSGNNGIANGYAQRTYTAAGAYGAPTTTLSQAGFNNGVLLSFRPGGGTNRAIVTWAEVAVPPVSGTTATRTIPLTAALQTTSIRAIPLSAALLTTTTRSVPLSAALQTTRVRTIPLSAALQATLVRTVPLSAALQVTVTRTVPLTAALLTTSVRAVPLTAALLTTGVRTIPLTIALSIASSTVATDTFTEASDTPLGSHFSDSGDTWALHPSASTGGATVLGGVGRAYANNNVTLFSISATPASNDYTVAARIHVLTRPASTAFVGIVGRSDTSSFAYVRAGFNRDDNSWYLQDYDGATFTTIGTYASALINGSDHDLELVLSGTTATMRVDGVQRATGTVSRTTGATGLFMQDGNASSTTGYHFDSFTLTQGAAPLVRTIPLTIALLTTRTRAIPLSAALQTTAVRSIPLAAALQTTATRAIPLTAALLTARTRPIPLTAALLTTSVRTVPLTAALQTTRTRAIPLTAALLTTTTRVIPLTAALQTTRTRGIPLTIALSTAGTLTRVIPLSIALTTTRVRAIPLSAALLTTSSRTIPLTAALLTTRTRAVPLTVALLKTNVRAIPATIALATPGLYRTVPLSMALATTRGRTVPLSVALSATGTRTIPLTIALAYGVPGADAPLMLVPLRTTVLNGGPQTATVQSDGVQLTVVQDSGLQTVVMQDSGLQTATVLVASQGAAVLDNGILTVTVLSDGIQLVTVLEG